MIEFLKKVQLVHLKHKCLTGAKEPALLKVLKSPEAIMGRRIGAIGGDQLLGRKPWKIQQSYLFYSQGVLNKSLKPKKEAISLKF